MVMEIILIIMAFHERKPFISAIPKFFNSHLSTFILHSNNWSSLFDGRELGNQVVAQLCSKLMAYIESETLFSF